MRIPVFLYCLFICLIYLYTPTSRFRSFAPRRPAVVVVVVLPRRPTAPPRLFAYLSAYLPIYLSTYLQGRRTSAHAAATATAYAITSAWLCCAPVPLLLRHYRHAILVMHLPFLSPLRVTLTPAPTPTPANNARDRQKPNRRTGRQARETLGGAD